MLSAGLCLLDLMLSISSTVSGQEHHASVDMEGAMESAGESLCVGALSALTFLF